MKKLLPFILLLSFFSAAKAQFVTIPDDNFRTFLKSKYQICFNASDQLDTTCNNVLNTDTIKCRNLNIGSLEGIQYFKKLRYLDCGNNQLINLPILSNVLGTLICDSNKLTDLPSLAAMKNLDKLACPFNLLMQLPPLPQVVQLLFMDHNKINCLPAKMPRVTLFSMDSSISCINSSAYYNIAWVSVYGKNSTGTGATIFSNTWGGYTTMPCYDCPPVMPKYTICTPANNVNGCTLPSIIAGNVFFDNNKNGVKDIEELDAIGIPVNLSYAKTYTNEDGKYKLGVELKGNYNLTIAPPNYFTGTPSNVSITFSGNDTLVTQDFALQATQNVDSLVIDVTPIFSRARPGFAYSMLITYKNAGTTNLTSNILIDYDESKLLYDSSSNHSVINTTNALSLSTGTLMPGEFKSFVAYYKVKPSIAIGDSIISFAAITNGVVTATDSSKSYVTGSYDPNDKQATPTLTPSQVTNGEYINYTIRFQNTGNDTAFNIVIADTLNVQLQTESFVIVNSSHPCNITSIGSIVYFEFLNILLPDSNINEPASHGFVTFKIRALKTVKNNDAIPNKAYIYFDYNTPIITNTAITRIYISPPVPVGLKNFSATEITNNQLLFYWGIENELNSKNFELQISTDGTHFTGISTINAQGVSSYSFASAMPEEMITYYRLKINDKDGSSSYSNIIKVQQQKTKAGLMVTNPVKNNLIINVTEKSLENTEAVLVNSNGQVIKKITLHYGIQNTAISKVTKGTYYLKTKQGNIKLIVL